MTENVAASTVVDQLDAETQRRLVAQLREVWRHAPGRHPKAIGGTLMRVEVTAAGELGWWGDGFSYHYRRRHPDGYAWPPIPDEWLQLWDRYSTRPDLRPDTAVINRYADGDPKMGLGWHADLTELDTTLPIVTISLGRPASWAVREREGAPVSRCRLETGAVVVLAGATRALEHTIERLLEPELQLGLAIAPPPRNFVPMPPPLEGGRVSITMRVAGSEQAAAAAKARSSTSPAPVVTYDRAREYLEEFRRRTGRAGRAVGV